MRQVVRIFDLLEALAERGDASLAELSEALALPRATTHRLLVSLQARGYVEHDVSGRRYRLGSSVRELAARSTASALVRLAGPALSQLRGSTGETANLAVVRGSRIVYAATLDGVHQPRMSAGVGQEVEAHATALGKAVLAALEPRARLALLPPEPYPAYTPRTITRADALEDELARCAGRGYALELEESTLGAACIAAVILDGGGAPVGALSVSGASARLPRSVQAGVAAQVVELCARIADELAPAAPELREVV